MRLFVGGLQYDMHEDMIRKEFEKYGTVTLLELVPDRIKGNNKGFGFVEMEDENEANKAMQAMNGMDFNGKKLTVSQAIEKKKNSSL